MGLFRWLFGRRGKKEAAKSHAADVYEDRLARAQIEERRAETEARDAHAQMDRAVQEYRAAEGRNAPQFELLRLRTAVERARKSFLALLSALESKAKNVDLVAELRNSKVVSEAARVFVSKEEIREGAHEAVTQLDEQMEVAEVGRINEEVLEGRIQQQLGEMASLDAESWLTPENKPFSEEKTPPARQAERKPVEKPMTE